MSFFNSTFLGGGEESAGRAVQGQSASSFGFSLLAGIALSVGQIAAFVILKDKLPQIYQPKSFLVSERQRSKPIPPGVWQWIKPIFQKSDDDFLRRCGLDAFFLCRYLLVLLKILGPVSLLIMPILLPINAVGGNNVEANIQGTQRNLTQGLDILTMSNIQPKLYDRLWAHCLLAVVVVIWSCYVIVQELRYFVRVRQQYLTSPQHRIRASAATVLVQALPRKYMDQEKLTELFDVYPGGIRNVWVNRDYDELADLVEDRDDLAKKLEEAEAELIQLCWKAHQKRLGDSKKKPDSTDVSKLDGQQDEDVVNTQLDGHGISANDPGQVHHNVDDAIDAINRSVAIEETEVAEKGNLFGRGVDAVAQGFQNIGRGIGDGFGQIGQVGKRIGGRGPEEKDNNTHRVRSQSKHLIGALSRRRRGKSEFVDQPETDEHLEVSEREVRDERAEPQDSLDQGRSAQLETDVSTNRDSEQSDEKTKNLPYDVYFNEDSHLEPKWKKYIDDKDRPTMKVSIRWKWCPHWMNPVATKVDAIYYCRREVARLNKVIEEQQRPEAEEKFPKMKSAFVQFNNQAAAHMCCQSVAHHTPSFMVPRLVETAPNDVLWNNMSIPGWQQYVRTGVVFIICIACVIAWTPLIAASSAISQLDALRKTKGFTWLQGVPNIVISIVQGILPVILVSVLILLLGLLLRFIVKYQGAPTRMQVEISVQKYFFVFSFIQYFIVVTISSAITLLFNTVSTALTKGNLSVFIIPQLLAQNIPQSTNYFLSNILLQSLSQSAGGLLQPGALWLFGWRLVFKKMARDKFTARTKMQNMKWGTTYPMYTTLACVALIYSVISPLILPLSLVGFGIWWMSTRYQLLYIYQFTTDTGGLLFPMAIKQLFTGLFTLELVLIGYFIIVATGSTTAEAPDEAVIPMTVVMAVVFVGTVLFYIVLKSSFDPLLKYLPITLEDDAVRRDEEFERLLAEKHQPQEEEDLMEGAAEGGPEDHDDDPDVSEQQLEHERAQDVEAQTQETTAPVAQREDGGRIPLDGKRPDGVQRKESLRTKLNPKNILRPHAPPVGSGHWAERKRRSVAWDSRSPSQHLSTRSSATIPADELDRRAAEASADSEVPALPAQDANEAHGDARQKLLPRPHSGSSHPRSSHRRSTGPKGADAVLALLSKPLAAPIGFVNPDQETVEARNEAFAAEANELYGNIPDDLEDLSPEERDVLLSRAFRHAALRAKRPCVWLPRDPLGVSDDEIQNTQKFTTWIWISNEKQVLNEKGKFIYKGPPPDFDEVDLIQL